MRSIHSAYVIGLLVALSAPAAAASTLTFDDITTNHCCDSVPDGYGGLKWQNFAVHSNNSALAGYANAAVSGSYSIFNGNGGTATVLEATTPFSLESGYFTAAWNEGLVVSVTGYSGQTVTASTTLTVGTNGPTFERFDWSGLTSVQFTSAGGVENPANAGLGGGTQFAMDNLTVDLRHAVPEPATWTMFLIGFGAIGFAIRRRQLATVHANTFKDLDLVRRVGGCLPQV